MTDQEPKQEPKQDQAGGAAGEPDLKEANKRLTAELASLKAEKASLEQQLKETQTARETLDKQLADALTEDDVKAAVEKAREDAKAQADEAERGWRAREKSLTVENALIAAGCVDAKAAMAHVDLDTVEVASDGHISGLDTKGLAEARPYLFATSNMASVNSALDPAGNANKPMTRKDIAKITDPKERMKLIEQSIEATQD